MTGAARPLAGPLGAIVAFGLALLMCWPILLTGDAYVFFDTKGYLSMGDQILAPLLGGGGEAGGGGLPSASGPDEPASPLRSFAYGIFFATLNLIGGGLTIALGQGWLTIWTALILVPREAFARPVPALAILSLAALTTLPWYVSYMMPDLLAALVIAYGAVLWRAFDEIGPLMRILLGLFAAFALISHYGHPPMAAGLFGLVLLARAVQRRLTLSVAAAAVLPILFALLGNLGASSVALDQPSMAPKRLPILLARSIEDGPAAWYLAEACPAGEDLAICAAFDGEVPDDITAFLWGPGGIRSLTGSQLSAIRDEEARILWAAFRAYPVAQTASLLSNAALQTVRVGLSELSPAPTSDLLAAPQPEGRPSEALRRTFDPVVEGTTLLGALALLAACIARPARFAPVLIVVGGLFANAAIFGGLSAPVDRYQGRVVWLIPFLALIFLAETMNRRHSVSQVQRDDTGIITR